MADNDLNRTLQDGAILEAGDASAEEKPVAFLEAGDVSAEEKPVAILEAGDVSAEKPVNDYWKKAGCAVTGGMITAVGLVMIPAPTPCGALVAAYGLSVLGREFEGAQKIVEGTKEKLEGGLDAWAKDWGRDDGEESNNDDNDEGPHTTQQEANSLEDDWQEVEKADSEPQEDSELQEKCKEGVEESSKPEQTPFMNDAHKALLEQKIEQKVEKGSPLDAWGKAWKSHTTNFRKGTSSFITNNVLPALRDLDLKHKKDNATTVSAEEDAVVVQIGDNEEIKLSKEEIDMIKETIDNEPSSDAAISSTDTSIVPDYTESMASDSSQSNTEDDEEDPLEAKPEEKESISTESTLNILST